ncbi:UDP-N-acetylmuramate dehydrogenase [Parablautia muri]|uniref:UDP-N-acetylenolpyruvoylglucosamine reductase n=1 Tax=Parablautia muri TaxID=2320879 RepID=A0A9X5BDU5_9FIRM|nr:UDP-N-acetylmuramate dehydrogenase [Parablautia muri]NBJ91862.1 UDP-N-acetylmuramate dehydrogenase [Parablautia muri]
MVSEALPGYAKGVKVEKISSAIHEFIKANVPGEDILLDEPMCKHTTFRVGGRAQCLVRISSIRQLEKLIPYLKTVGVPYFVLGNGSNLLVGDKGYKGIVLQIGSKMGTAMVEGACIRAGAGLAMIQAARCAQENGLSGLEFASGIPGTLGGGIVMNAGAYGGEMKQVVKEVTVLSDQGEILTLDNASMEFGYRTSVIKNRPFVVIGALLGLVPGKKEEIFERMEALAKKRREKQPIEYASAGSTFKRPEGYFAGKLIMDTGLKGYRVGGAMVSEKHCGFVINTGTATAADIAQVIWEVQERVKDKFGVTLEKEVIFLGDF